MSVSPRVRGPVVATVTVPGVTITNEVPNRCALCSGESRSLFRVDGALIVACNECGLVRQDTRPVSPGEFYDSAYYATDNPKGGYSNYFLDADVNRVTPNVGGFQARALRDKWYHYKPGEHLFYFSPTTLRAAIERAKLEWLGWGRAGSYLTLTYVFDRLRYYAKPFGLLQVLGRKLRFGPLTFYLHVGEMEAWARRSQ